MAIDIINNNAGSIFADKDTVANILGISKESLDGLFQKGITKIGKKEGVVCYTPEILNTLKLKNSNKKKS